VRINLDCINIDGANLDFQNSKPGIILELNDSAFDLHIKAKMFLCGWCEATAPSE